MKIENKVKKTLKNIKLNKNENILVALSGGKDSAVTAFILKKLGYNIKGLYVNLCVGDYSEKCLNAIKELCGLLKIELEVYNLKKEKGKGMKEIWKQNKNLNHCAACGVVKKSVLNEKARKLKVNKIATGHNLDDEVQTFLLNILKGSPELSANTGAIIKNPEGSKTGKFIPRVKPLFYIEEKEILDYAKKNKIPFISGKCPFATTSYRIEIRDFLKQLNKKQKQNIIRNFEKIQSDLEKIRDKQENYCEICGEPSRGRICKVCEILERDKNIK